jgi:hypothetical protein
LISPKKRYPEQRWFVSIGGERSFQDLRPRLAALKRWLKRRERGRINHGPRLGGDDFPAACDGGHE